MHYTFAKFLEFNELLQNALGGRQFVRQSGVDGDRHANGTAEGLEDGPYTVYRENGVPYYQGTYSKGQRVGIWEFYDEEGNLDNTVDYSAKSSNNK